MIWGTIAFDREVPDDRLIEAFTLAFRLNQGEVMVAQTDGSRVSGTPQTGVNQP